MLIVTRDVQADPGRIFEVLTDVGDWPRWTESMTAVRRLDDGPLALGSRAEVDQPKLRSSIWEVTAIRRPGQDAEGAWRSLLTTTGLGDDAVGFFWAARNPGVTSVGGHVVAPNGTGSRLVLTVEHTGPLAFVVRALVGSRTEEYVGMEADGMVRAAAQKNERP